MASIFSPDAWLASRLCFRKVYSSTLVLVSAIKQDKVHSPLDRLFLVMRVYCSATVTFHAFSIECWLQVPVPSFPIFPSHSKNKTPIFKIERF